MASRVLYRSFHPLMRSARSPILSSARPSPSLLLRRSVPKVRFYSSNITTAPAPSLSQRLKALSKEYGYSALGVYLALSALDFPFCFLAVRYLGTERIGRWEEAAVGFVKPYWTALRHSVGFPAAEKVTAEGEEVHGRWEEVEGAEREVERSASLWTELALAYAIHKSFIFIRVPLTAAVTPRVVKVLRGWGWDIGKKGKPKIGKIPGRKSD